MMNQYDNNAFGDRRDDNNVHDEEDQTDDITLDNIEILLCLNTDKNGDEQYSEWCQTKNEAIDIGYRRFHEDMHWYTGFSVMEINHMNNERRFLYDFDKNDRGIYLIRYNNDFEINRLHHLPHKILPPVDGNGRVLVACFDGFERIKIRKMRGVIDDTEYRPHVSINKKVRHLFYDDGRPGFFDKYSLDDVEKEVTIEFSDPKSLEIFKERFRDVLISSNDTQLVIMWKKVPERQEVYDSDLGRNIVLWNCQLRERIMRLKGVYRIHD